MLRRWAAMYLSKSKSDPGSEPGPVSGDSYSEPFSSNASWWSGMHRAVNHVLVVSGSEEVFADRIGCFTVEFKKGWLTRRWIDGVDSI